MILPINIPDDVSARVIRALSELEGWTPDTVDAEGAPVTRVQAAKLRVIRSIKADVRLYETQSEAEGLNLS